MNRNQLLTGQFDELSRDLMFSILLFILGELSRFYGPVSMMASIVQRGKGTDMEIIGL